MVFTTPIPVAGYGRPADAKGLTVDIFPCQPSVGPPAVGSVFKNLGWCGNHQYLPKPGESKRHGCPQCSSELFLIDAGNPAIETYLSEVPFH